MSLHMNADADFMDFPNTAKYEVTGSLWMLLVGFYGQNGLALCLLALLSIAGIVALPVMVPAWVAARAYSKSKRARSVEAAYAAFSQRGFTVTRTLSPGGATLLIDEARKAVSYWEDDVPVFQAGIALFEEISGVEWTKDGDIHQSVAPGVIVMARRGRVVFGIALSRLDDPSFSFRCHSEQAAAKLMQQLSILADLQ